MISAMLPAMLPTVLLLLPSPALAIDRPGALDHAAAYALHAWTSTAANGYASCVSGYESDYGPGAHTGLPYDWGGYMTLAEFDQQIADGYGAGSHSWHGILWCTAGVDCSGYVSQVWETDHYSTSTFYNVTHDISAADVLPGDAFNDAGSHIVLYTYETDAGTPVFYEASGGAEQVRVNGTSGWSYLSGYTPIRFDGMQDGSFTPGTAAAPLEIGAFPFTDQRWTAGAASDTLDGYSCAPDTDESGPEMLYHFYTPTGGTLSAVVSDDEGVDIDLHVLTALSAASCLARNDTTVSVDVPAGDVYLSLDTWVGSSEYPGPYLLTATFTGTVGDPGDPGDSGGPTDSDPADSDPADSDPADSGQTDSSPADSADHAGWLGLPGERTAMDGISGGCATAAAPDRDRGAGLIAQALALAGIAGLRRRRQKTG